MGADDNSNEAANLAKVLWYYNLVYDVRALKQKIICPLHDNDVNPSMLIDLESGSWFCFGCQQGGDAFKFVQLLEKKLHGLNDLQSYMKYVKILKSDKCSDIKLATVKVLKTKKQDRQLYDIAYDYYHGLKMVDWKYSMEDEVIEALLYMRKRGYSQDTLMAVGAKITYNRQYGLIFPMLDNGKFKGWVCRTMRKDVEAKRKYLYNDGFSRATTLVGNYGKDKYVIVVEGYMDRLRFIEFGVPDSVVAILGWKMSAQQESKIRAAGITVVISCLDNDECGRKGTLHLKTVFGPRNVLRWSYLKGVKDPGEMSREQFDKMYKKTMAEYRQLLGVRGEC